MHHLGTVLALATLALSGCAAPSPSAGLRRGQALPPPVSLPAPAPSPTAIDDWMSECKITLGGTHLVAEGMIEAYREKDIIKLVCLDDKQKQVDALLKVMSDHLGRVACVSDEDQLRHELMVLQVACRKIDLVRQEAMSCVGEELFFVAKS